MERQHETAVCCLQAFSGENVLLLIFLKREQQIRVQFVCNCYQQSIIFYLYRSNQVVHVPREDFLFCGGLSLQPHVRTSPSSSFT